jgi:H+-transporting ATPase
MIVMEDGFKLLQCDENGLSPEEAQRRLALFGP